MSNTDVKKDFAEFGKKAQILAILSLIMFIMGIVGFIVPVVSYISIVFLVIYVIFLILALGNIKNAANKLNNQDLFTFRSRIIIALILALIGFLFFTIGIGGIIAIAYGPDAGSPQAVGGYIAFGIMILIAIVVLIIALIMEILGWSSLRRFFKANKSMFPEKIVSNAETACLLLMLGIIPIIGPLLRIIGYFLLSNLREL
ncbi:MAG: hypothetical protein EU532_10020 [Promethearchaeota archaeon]|nr:MAG: hypothetical protein EU532_10020 [Candidatus Lokiarchaeota archaeon]